MMLQQIKLGKVKTRQKFSWSEDEQPTDIVKYEDGLLRCANENGAGYTCTPDANVWVEMTCGECKHCSPITNVAGADCECKANSASVQFEVSQDDDICFYGKRENEPCEFFVTAD